MRGPKKSRARRIGIARLPEIVADPEAVLHYTGRPAMPTDLREYLSVYVGDGPDVEGDDKNFIRDSVFEFVAVTWRYQTSRSDLVGWTLGTRRHDWE